MSEFRPLEGDADIPEAQMLVSNIGTDHLLVDTMTTCGAEVMKNDGSNWQQTIIVEFEGRFNRTDREGSMKAVLGLEAAVILHQNLGHSLLALLGEDDD